MSVGLNGSEFLVNINKANDQLVSSIAALADGRFAVVWRSGTTNVNDSIRMRVFNSDGFPFGAETVVATGRVDLPAITGLADGSIAIAWSQIKGAGVASTMLRVFDGSGEATTAPMMGIAGSNAVHATPLLAASADGFVLGNTQVQTLKTYGLEGEVLGSIDAGLAEQGALAAFADGRYVVVSAVGDVVRYQLFGAGVSDTPHELVQATTAGLDGSPSVAVLANQSMVIVWDDAAAGPQARIILSSGAAVSLDIDDFGNPPKIAPLLDGRFVLVWQGLDGVSTSQVFAQIRNANGTASGAPFVVGDALAATNATPSVAALGDGTFVISWRTDDGDGVAGGTTNSGDIRAQIFDPSRFTGTTGADVYAGGELADRINGDAGNDIFHGNGGNDVINGDGGGDQLFGDAGNDSLFGGAGADQLQGGAGDDLLSGGGGDDILDGGDGVDRVLGGAGNDTIVLNRFFDASGEVYDGGSGSGDILSIAVYHNLQDDTVRGFEIIELSGSALMLATQLSGLTELRGQGTLNIEMVEGQSIFDLSGVSTANFGLTGPSAIGIVGTNGGDEVITGTDFGDSFFPLFGEDTIFARGGDDTVSLFRSDSLGKTLDGGDGVDTIKLGGNEGYTADLSVNSLTSFEVLMIQAISDNFSLYPVVVKLGVTQLAGNGGDIAMINSASGDASPRTISLELVMGAATTFNLSTLPITGLSGPSDILRISGDADSENIAGSDRNETISSGGGTDILTGLGGNDTYLLGDGAASVVEAIDGGIDTIISTISRNLAGFSNVENLILTNASGLVSGIGSASANVLDGVQGAGAADLAGLGGDDIYLLGVGDTATETLSGAAGGIDTVNTRLTTFTLGANIENLTMTGGNASSMATGNELDNVLRATNFATNTLVGLGGNDTYIVDRFDTVVEAAGGGIDTVMSSENITIGDNVENLALLGNDGFDGPRTGTGNALDNVLDGTQSAAANRFFGEGGNDTYIVDAGDSVTERTAGSAGGVDLIRTAFARTLAANVENLTLTGTSAVAGIGNELANVLDGSENSASNTLWGLVGNDTYILGIGDIADETGGGAGDMDLVKAAFSFSLNNAALVIGDIENLTLTGGLAINGIGNGLGNTLTGNGSDNVLQGLGGADTLDGGAGIDTADYSEKTASVAVTLNGSIAVVRIGGLVEDTVRNIENVTGGSVADTLVGDDFANRLVGNAGADKLTGGGGNDVLRGGLGTDTLDGGTGSDTADYSDKGTAVSVTLNGAASVTVFVNGIKEDSIVNIENVVGGSGADTLIGDGLGNTFTGGKGDDTLSGNGGSDRLIGGFGRDFLSGGTGNDLFVFGDASDSGITAKEQDLILDFTKGEDRIDVSGIDARTISSFGDDAFNSIVQGTASTSFGGVQGRIIWFQVNNANDDLDRTFIRFNIDTDNTPEMQIELKGLLSLDSTDFLL